MMHISRFLVWIALASPAWAQPAGLTARELYFEGQPGQASAAAGPPKKAEASSKIPPRTAARQRKNQPVTSSRKNASQGEVVAASNVPASATGTTPTIVPVALRLGLRYNLMLVDDMTTRRSHEVDPDGQFKTGDCFQVRLRPNRSGRMYVFNQGSSGNFSALLPSVLAPDEPVDVVANQEITVARDHCFQLDDRKGVDKLIVMITDRPDDVRDLSRPLPSTPDSTQLALRVKSIFESQAGLISRDMTIQKIGSSPNDPPNSVYVVKTAASESDRLTIEIPLRHE